MPRKKGFLPKNYKNIFIKNSNDDSRINEMMYSLKLVEKVFNDKEVFENLTKFINGFLSVEGGGGGILADKFSPIEPYNFNTSFLQLL